MLDFTLKLIKLTDCIQRNLGHRAFVGGKQLEELAPGVRPTPASSAWPLSNNAW